MSLGSFQDDASYVALIEQCLGVCRDYQPRFGGGRKSGYSLDEFRALYGQDPFYAWLGLDSPLVFAAHRAAGGITSLYRQIGIACERLFRRIVQDKLGISASDVAWTYVARSTRGKTRK